MKRQPTRKLRLSHHPFLSPDHTKLRIKNHWSPLSFLLSVRSLLGYTEFLDPLSRSNCHPLSLFAWKKKQKNGWKKEVKSTHEWTLNFKKLFEHAWKGSWLLPAAPDSGYQQCDYSLYFLANTLKKLWCSA